MSFPRPAFRATAVIAAAAFAFAWSVTLAQAAPFVYVANYWPGGFPPPPGEVSQYGVGAGGLLAPLDPATVTNPGGHAEGLTVSPDGRSVYVANSVCGAALTNGCVSQYDVGPDGRLAPKNPPTVPSGDGAASVAVSPDGQSVYVGAYSVYQYDVGAGGVLSPKSPASVPLDYFANEVAVSPDGQSLYVATCCGFRTAGAIAQFDVGAGGALSPKSPASLASGFATGLAVSPDGGSVYLTDNGRVQQYDVGPGGVLSPKSPASVPSVAGTYSYAPTVSPDGRSVYVANSSCTRLPPTGCVSQYDVGAGGALAPKSPATVPAGDNPHGVAVSPDGRSVYVTNTGGAPFDPPSGDNLSQYDVGSGGALSPKSPATVPAGDGPYGVAVTPPPRVPTTPKQCGDGGWKQFGFNNQGRCVAFVLLTRICDALERQGIHLKFCPPIFPNPLRPS